MDCTAWKLTKAIYCDSACKGYGSILHAGRWHRRGIPVVYASDSPTLALLETLVHVEHPDLLVFDYVAIPIRFDRKHLSVLQPSNLPGDWNTWPWPSSTQQLGHTWFNKRQSAVLAVPSVVVPRQSRYLINPLHIDFGQVEIGKPEPFPVDTRLK